MIRIIFKILIIFIIISINSVDLILKELQYNFLITDNENNFINGDVTLTFRIYSSEDGNDSDKVWQEVKNLNIVNGSANIMLGTDSTLNDIDFSQELWLEVRLDNNDPFPRTKINSVPFALFASKADIANIAITITDSSLSQEKLDPGVMAIPKGSAGGYFLNGYYPNPTIKLDSIISAIPPGGITQDKLAARISAIPIGEARGDLVGFYPGPTIRPGVIKSQYFADTVITSDIIGPYAINSRHIADSAVTQEKLDSNATTYLLGKVGGDLEGFYPNPDIDTGSINSEYLANSPGTGTAGQYFKSNGDSSFVWISLNQMKTVTFKNLSSLGQYSVIRITYNSGNAILPSEVDNGKILRIINVSGSAIVYGSKTINNNETATFIYFNGWYPVN